MTRLAVENLSVGNGSAEIVQGISFTIAARETLCLMGGAGKSTLLKGIVGLLRPQEGKVSLDDCEITGWSPRRLPRLGIGYAPQEEFLFSDFTVRGKPAYCASELDQVFNLL